MLLKTPFTKNYNNLSKIYNSCNQFLDLQQNKHSVQQNFQTYKINAIKVVNVINNYNDYYLQEKTHSVPHFNAHNFQTYKTRSIVYNKTPH